MAASLWAKASVSAAGIVFRASRYAPKLQRVSLAGPVTAHRFNTTSAALRKETLEESTLDRVAPETRTDSEPEAKKSLHSDQPEFTTLKGNVSSETLKAITVSPYKLKHMTPVQTAVLSLLPALAEPYKPQSPEDNAPRPSRDLLVRAKTGTGKTLAFLVPAIEARLNALRAHGKQAVTDAGLVSDKRIEAQARRIFSRTNVGTLIISPTRELATQISNEALQLSCHHDFEVRLMVGGNSKQQQMRDFMRGRRDIVVATPGRLRDLLENEPEVSKSISKAQLLILDEADTLLDMGFRDDIDAITKFLLPTPQRQTFMFSATVSTQIRQVARATLEKDHHFINCVTNDAPPIHAHIPQYHTVLPSAGHQIPHILRLLAHDQLLNPGASKTIVFLPTTKMTQLFATLLRQLSKTCLPAGRDTHIYEIHSKRPQRSRDNTSTDFRKDKSGASILISSDVSARGVDYPGVTRIIQVGIPSASDQYIHRVGRTGRGLNTHGRADLVLLPWEVGFVTWELTHIPLKPLTTNELKNQVTELAKKYDEDPDASFKDVKTTRPSKEFSDRTRFADRGPRQFNAPYTPVLENIPESINQLLPQLDEEAIKETMASLLGYYVSKSAELRVQRPVIVQGCKDWTVDAMGLPTPPYVSDAFLDRLGANDGRTKRFGQSRDNERRFSRSAGGPHWVGRGNQRNNSGAGDRGYERSSDRSYPRRDGGYERSSDRSYSRRDGGFERSSDRSHFKRDPRDPSGSPDEYRSQRYRG
ncbi:hypothetical protein AcV7_001601 [Taiwanofungus camphoratus]|nr:hypothetical protein AcV7_001601 [Antrodia cinnamomea]